MLGRRLRFRVSGDSMNPALSEGEQVLVDPRASAIPGALVLLRHPNDTDLVLIKRVTEITNSGGLHVRGDNPEASTDSRQFGAVDSDLVLGRVTARLR